MREFKEEIASPKRCSHVDVCSSALANALNLVVVDLRYGVALYTTSVVAPPNIYNSRVKFITGLGVIGEKATRRRVRRLGPNVTVRLKMPYSRFFSCVVLGFLLADFPETRRVVQIFSRYRPAFSAVRKSSARGRKT
jgi:hypothetical protein